MLNLLLAATLTLSQPESIHFESGLEPGVRYEFDCRWAHQRNSVWVQNAVGYVSLEFKRSWWNGDRLQATIDVFGLPPDQELYDQIDFTQDDLCVDIEFRLSGLEVTGIEDWERVRDESIQIIERYTAALVEHGLLQQDETQSAVDSISSSLSTDESCLRFFSDRISPYLDGYNWTLHKVEMLEQDTEYPNPFGGKPLPGYRRIYIKDDPKTEATIEYRMNVYLDTLGAMRAMRPELAKLGYTRDEVEQRLSRVEVDYWYYWTYDESRSLITNAVLDGATILPDQDVHVVRRFWELTEAKRIKD